MEMFDNLCTLMEVDSSSFLAFSKFTGGASPSGSHLTPPVVRKTDNVEVKIN